MKIIVLKNAAGNIVCVSLSVIFERIWPKIPIWIKLLGAEDEEKCNFSISPAESFQQQSPPGFLIEIEIETLYFRGGSRTTSERQNLFSSPSFGWFVTALFSEKSLKVSESRTEKKTGWFVFEILTLKQIAVQKKRNRFMAANQQFWFIYYI